VADGEGWQGREGWDTEEHPALGVVLETDRGSLPFALLHGEALVTCAAWALGEAGFTQVDVGTAWEAVAEAAVDGGEPLVLHDSLCPMTPTAFLLACVARAVESGAVVVGVRPVTDTLKTVDDQGVVGGTVDREAALQVTSPVVLPATVVAALDVLPTTDLAALVAQLATRFPVVTMEAPPEGRRVADEHDVRVLEALTRG
jgi:2-C-methyl-D-erythritol 4-phosphate cytidylyltransferase